MKNSLLIIIFFSFGIFLARLSLLPEIMLQIDFSLYALYMLLFLVGIGIGSEEQAWVAIKKLNIEIIVVPLSVIIGTFIGVIIFSLFLPGWTLKESLAVGAGFGYYSLSSILITQISGQTLGVVALLANLMREIFTLLFAVLLVKYFGKLSPVASGGATAMDTTLPVITKFAGREYGLIAVFSGIILTILAPFLIILILKS